MWVDFPVQSLPPNRRCFDIVVESERVRFGFRFEIDGDFGLGFDLAKVDTGKTTKFVNIFGVTFGTCMW